MPYNTGTEDCKSKFLMYRVELKVFQEDLKPSVKSRS